MTILRTHNKRPGRHINKSKIDTGGRNGSFVTSLWGGYTGALSLLLCWGWFGLRVNLLRRRRTGVLLYNGLPWRC